MPQSRTSRPSGHRSTRRQPLISCTRDEGGFGEAVLVELDGGGFRPAVVVGTARHAKRNHAPLAPRRAFAHTFFHKLSMSHALPPCPCLPAPRAGLDWQALHNFREADRGAEFYFACLEYGHSLWQRG